MMLIGKAQISAIPPSKVVLTGRIAAGHVEFSNRLSGDYYNFAAVQFPEGA